VSTFTYGDLIDWSHGLKPWHGDALRRILNSNLTQTDTQDLAAMAKAAHGIKPASAPTPIPPTRAYLQPAAGSASVSLVRLRDITNVNALGSGPLTFGPQGLTIIYGDNASGKSGVARILKKAGHARDPGGPIRPCIFEPDPGKPATATIDFCNGTEERAYQWTDGAPARNELRQINVFDARCAAIQVEKDNRLAYTPQLLQTFQDLAATLQAVGTTIKDEIEALDKDRPPEIQELSLRAGTAAAVLIANLSARTPLKDVDAICDLTSDERDRITAIRRALNDNLSNQIALLDAQSRALKDLDELVSAIDRLLSDAAMLEFDRTLSDAIATAKAAQEAQTAFAEHSTLAGIGGEAWRALWESARRYSQTAAYPAERFPVTAIDAICLLCQQPIGRTAADRLNRFEQFIQNDTQRRAGDMRRALEDRTRELRDLVVPLSGVILRKAAVKEAPTGARMKTFLAAAKIRRRHLLRRAKGFQTSSAPLPTRPDLSEVRGSLAKEITRLRTAAQTEERRKMQIELAEFEDRLKLEPLRNTIKREIARLGHRRLLEGARDDCDTTRITRKAGDVTKLVITNRLRSAFAANLSRLGFNSAPVEMKLGPGSIGQYPYHVGLMARPDVPPTEILSEGERTCVALAGFLAELETSQNLSSIVLDDPVSSLDHHYRVRVARLLVECARQRQVIIFTHDVVFLFMLNKYAQAEGVPVMECSLRRGVSRHGIPAEGPPWVAMPVRRRIGFLRNELQAAEAVLRKGDRQTYEQKAKLIYERLRESWERAVEEVLLDKVVVRFTDAVETKRLKTLTDITESDVQTVDTEMSYCSSLVHDESGAVNAGIPEPPAVKSDIDRLEAWIAAIKQRRK
jgi:AAA domain